jgi:uncharacterized delta-60 repeat protein
MFKRLILLVVILLAVLQIAWFGVSMPAFAESVDTAWVRMYNGPGTDYDEAYVITVDDSGNVFVAGYSYYSATSEDYVTIKYFPDGDTAWVRTYNGPGNGDDEVNAIAVDDSGNVYVTGYSTGSATEYDYATIKYLPNGDTAWVRRYNGPGNDRDQANAIAVDDSGYVYVTGRSDGSGTNGDYATIKYYPSGDTVWIRRYSEAGNSYDLAYSITVDNSSHVYVTGTTYNSVTLNDYTTIKYYPNGDTAWVRVYNDPANGSDIAKAIALDHANNVYVSGNSSGTENGYVTIKYYPDGDTAWIRRYNGSGSEHDIVYAIAVDDSNRLYVTGYSYDSGTLADYVTIKYYSNGDTAWLRTYNGPGNSNDYANAIAIDDSNNVYVTGYSYNSGTSDDYTTIKYYPNGDTAWVRTYNGPGNDYDQAYDIAVDGSGSVYVIGYSVGDGTGEDFATIKYVQKTSDVEEETERSEKPYEFDLSQNYPNPFNPTTKIEFTLSKSGFVTLQIYDIVGKKVRTLVSENLSSGYKSVIWDGKNEEGKEVASGIYFYQLKMGDFSEPKKMLLLK